MLNKLKRLLGFHVHEWHDTNIIPDNYPSSERWYYKIQECDCGDAREIMR